MDPRATGTCEGEAVTMPKQSIEFEQSQTEVTVPVWMKAGEGEDYEFLDRLSGAPSTERDQAIHWVRDLVYGGCISGMYMPAVTYREALSTMAEHGDDVLEYLRDSIGNFWPLLSLSDDDSWSFIASKVLSAAVEEWARNTLERLEVEER